MQQQTSHLKGGYHLVYLLRPPVVPVQQLREEIASKRWHVDERLPRDLEQRKARRAQVHAVLAEDAAIGAYTSSLETKIATVKVANRVVAVSNRRNKNTCIAFLCGMACIKYIPCCTWWSLLLRLSCSGHAVLFRCSAASGATLPLRHLHR